MLSIIYQIIGNIFLVWAIISRSFKGLVLDSTVNISIDAKRKNITKSLQIKAQIVIGLLYVIIGLLISIPSVHKLLQKCILFRNTLFIILFLIVIVFFSIGIILLIPKFYKKEIERVINVRKDGEIWIEDNSKLQNDQEAKNNDSSQETNTSTKEFDDDQLPNIPLKNKKKSFKRRPIIICFLVAFFILLLCAWPFIRVLQKYRCLESQIQQLIYLNQKINEIDNKLINHEITINDDLIFIRKEFLEEKNTIVNELSKTNYKNVTEIEK